MIKFPRFNDDPSNVEIDALNEKRGRVLSLLLSQPNTKAVLDVSVSFKEIYLIIVGYWGLFATFGQIFEFCWKSWITKTV